MKLRNGIRLLKKDESGFTFIEVLATFVMVTAAVIATAYSLHYGQRMLTIDMHKQQVLRMVQGEIEYWIGRLYTGNPDNGDPTVLELAGRTSAPYKTAYLDDVEGVPDSDKIQVRLYYDPIERRNDPGILAPHWVITVWAEWTEHDGQRFRRINGKHHNEISLTSMYSFLKFKT